MPPLAFFSQGSWPDDLNDRTHDYHVAWEGLVLYITAVRMNEEPNILFIISRNVKSKVVMKEEEGRESYVL